MTLNRKRVPFYSKLKDHCKTIDAELEKIGPKVQLKGKGLNDRERFT